MLDTKNSPSRNNYTKRPRKVNTFSAAVVHHTQVGEFQGGYFVMPVEENNNNNSYPTKKKAYSPARRKHSEPPLPNQKYSNPSSYSPSFPKKTPSSTYSSPSPVVVVSKKENKNCQPGFELLSPSHFKTPSSSKPIPLATSKESTPSCRFAGPAFGNAPHPSSLPIPEFPPFQPTAVPVENDPYGTNYFSTHGRSLSVDSSLSSLSSYPTQDPRSPSPPTHPSPSPSPSPSLDQLSIDLRRMLNIGA